MLAQPNAMYATPHKLLLKKGYWVPLPSYLDMSQEHKVDLKFNLKMNSKDWLLFEVLLSEIFFWLRHIFCLGDGFLNIWGRRPSSKCLLETPLLRNIWFDQDHTKFCLFTSSSVSQSQYEQMRGQRNGGNYECLTVAPRCKISLYFKNILDLSFL